MNKELTEILDYILNKASEKELVAIRAALKRRDNNMITQEGKSLSDMVIDMSSNIREQVNIPLKQIRQSVRDMVVRIVKENAPNITDQQLQILLNEWIPEKPGITKQENTLPPQILITMIKQFIAYSIGTIPADEEIKLRREMQNWPERYWNNFSEKIQQSISSYLKGKMEEQNFWKIILSELNIS